MAGVDPLNQFPNSMMAQAVRLGQSRFVSDDVGGSSPGTGAQPYNYTHVAGSQFALGCVAATALTVPATAAQAVVCAEGNDVRYTYDGVTTPTAAVGQKLSAGQCVQFSGADILARLKFIQIAATATLNVEYTK